MTVVVDASVLVAAAVDAGPAGAWAEDVLLGSELAGPHSLLVESVNALRRLEAGGEITRLEATAAQRALLRLRVEGYPFEPVAGRVWELRATVTAYDAWYVALAEGLDVPLATLDARLARAPGPSCEFLLPG